MIRTPRRRQMIVRAILLGGVIALSSATLFAGREGTLTTTDGQVVEGDITEKNGQFIVRRRGIDQVIDRENVSQIEYSTYAERFERSRTALAKDDVAGRVALAREAFDRHEYALAMKAVDEAVEIDPLNRDARQLQNLVSGQMHLESQRSSSRPVSPTPAPATTREAPETQRRTRGLTPEQANRVRLAELARQDRVRLQFRENVRQRFVASQTNLNYRNFTALPEVEQVFEILDKGDPALANDVIVMSDPGAIAFFGRRIQSAVLQGCATSSCHGGNEAGRFRLLTGTPDAFTTVTNFYLLSTYVQQLEEPDGTLFAPRTLAMISRGDAKQSLLYQYALPRKNALHKHPPVKGWDGLIRGENNRLERDLIDWIDGELLRIHMPYGFEFTLSGATTAPAEDTAPTTDGPATQPGDPS